MEKDLQNILRFRPLVTGLRYITNLDGTPKAMCDLGIPFDNLDFIPTGIGVTDSFYIGFQLPDGLTLVNAFVKYADDTTEVIEAQYDPVNHTIAGFTNNLPQSILIKTA